MIRKLFQNSTTLIDPLLYYRSMPTTVMKHMIKAMFPDGFEIFFDGQSGGNTL